MGFIHSAWTHPLIRDRVRRLAHELVDVLDRHFAVQLLEHGVALLEAEKHVLLDQRELDGGDLAPSAPRPRTWTDELLERLELIVRLDQKLLLILASPQRRQRSVLAARSERVLGGLTLALEDMLGLRVSDSRDAGVRTLRWYCLSLSRCSLRLTGQNVGAVDAHSRMARSCALIAGGLGALWPEPMRRERTLGRKEGGLFDA